MESPWCALWRLEVLAGNVRRYPPAVVLGQQRPGWGRPLISSGSQRPEALRTSPCYSRPQLLLITKVTRLQKIPKRSFWVTLVGRVCNRGVEGPSRPSDLRWSPVGCTPLGLLINLLLGGKIAGKSASVVEGRKDHTVFHFWVT